MILFSELKQHKIDKAIEILDNEIEFGSDSMNQVTWKELKKLTENKNWEAIDRIFTENENAELNKLKIKPVANNGYNKFGV